MYRLFHSVQADQEIHLHLVYHLSPVDRLTHYVQEFHPDQVRPVHRLFHRNQEALRHLSLHEVLEDQLNLDSPALLVALVDSISSKIDKSFQSRPPKICNNIVHIFMLLNNFRRIVKKEPAHEYPHSATPNRVP